MMSPKLELGINPVSEETWRGFPPSVMLGETGFIIPETKKKKKKEKNEATSS